MAPRSEQPDAADRLGTIDQIATVLAPLLNEVRNGALAQIQWPPFVAPTLGVSRLTVPALFDLLTVDLARTRINPSTGEPGRVLDTGIEAQVHGPIDLERDVERLVVDPSFARTPTGDHLNEIARKYGLPIDRHPGFCLEAREVPAEFRGPAIPKLAQRIAADGMVDAAVVGAAQHSLRLRPGEWPGWGEHADILQHLKQLWHVLVHCGRPEIQR